MRKILKACLILLCLLVLLPLALIKGYVEYHTWPITRFCNTLRQFDTRLSVAQSASHFQLTTMEVTDDKLWYFQPETGPFFRFACEVDYRQNRVHVSRIVSAD